MEKPAVEQGGETERQRKFEADKMTAYGILQAAYREIYDTTSLDPYDLEEILRDEADRIDRE